MATKIVIDEITFNFDQPSQDRYKSGMLFAMMLPTTGLNIASHVKDTVVVRQLKYIGGTEKWVLVAFSVSMSVPTMLRDAMTALHLPDGEWFHYRIDKPSFVKKVKSNQIRFGVKHIPGRPMVKAK